jgi:plasmid stabilization system protein ParE
MTQLTVSDAARADVRQIINYLEDVAARSVALRFARDFDLAFDRIADIPGIGSPRPEFGPNVRLSIVDPYLIFYDFIPSSDTVLVLRVLHGHRNITAAMLRSS